MYLCCVLTGEYALGQKDIVAPPTKGSNSVDLFDSVVDNMNSPNMFIVFHDDYAYPEYLITFKWVLKNSNLGARLLWFGLYDYAIHAFASLLYAMFEFFLLSVWLISCWFFSVITELVLNLRFKCLLHEIYSWFKGQSKHHYKFQELSVSDISVFSEIYYS